MDAIFGWVKTLIFFSLFLTIFMQLIPEKKYRKYIRFFAGMIFIILAVSPVFKFFSKGDLSENIFEQFAYQQESEKVSLDFEYMESQQQEYYQEQVKQAASELIDKAAAEQGFEMTGSSIELKEGSGEPEKITVFVREADETKEQERTAVEEIKIKIADDGGEKKEVSAARSGKLKEEIVSLFEIPEDQIQILEE
ncbi:stage III sporulation protein AF [uncultured Roseburia sp.]|uniref:Stage III sporulation protein AF n=1 Tax=Brotonthovivens ammoniilytica TaxID=2981725 RepID=A0ABT2TFK6_9FIRM|nr:stage III sporulation protein AF [Brotonthovivens ammoniilytica]MCU6760973.1 stage III sporulation protein AF [Brotonthovivens ammoniilytica]SCI15057.1 stage III sporulation protein AF [uncultured Roseburia sp.]